MTKLTYRELSDPRFLTQLNKLSNIETLPTEKAFRLSKALTELSKCLESFNKKRDTIVLKYVVKDAEGKLVTTDGKPKFTDSEALEKEINEILDTPVNVIIPKVTIKELGRNSGFSAQQLNTIDKFLDYKA